MSWQLSRFRAGDLVEVRSKQEILSTLDDRGCVGDLPFMPEMLAFCEKRLQVAAVAHKTCDPTYKTWGRRLESAVHLVDARCDGSAHGGCQASCNLFWNDAWLKSVDEPAGKQPASGPGCSEATLHASARAPAAGDASTSATRYSCQATKLIEASKPLPFWDVRQYVFDVVTRNHSARRVLRVVFLASLRAFVRRTPVGWRYAKAFSEWMHVRLTGRGSPHLSSRVPAGERTPTGRLGLKPGELVRIKSQEEIEHTVDKRGYNRGLSFDPDEMAPYCGRVVRVRSAVTQIIDEVRGTMRQMKEPCITLEGVVCRSEYAMCRLNCPREIPSYWREIWLERVSAGSAPARERESALEAHVRAPDSVSGNTRN